MKLPIPLKPMEPKMADKPFDSAEHIFQVKWDGVRCLTYSHGGNIQLFNRKLNERTHQYPELVELLQRICPDNTILDGEIIAFDENNKPNFRRVLKRDLIKNTSIIDSLIKKVPIYYMVFDLIYLNGRDLTQTPLIERQKLLQNLILENPLIKIVESFETHGIKLFEGVKNQGLEGIVAKKKSSKYIIGEKTDLWKKIKVWQKINAVIGGWTSKMGEIRSLLVGLYDDKENFYYIGNVSSGIKYNEWSILQKYFDLKKTNQSPFINPPRKTREEEIHWVEPEICLQMEYLEWTEDYRLRHPKVIKFLEINPKECKVKH